MLLLGLAAGLTWAVVTKSLLAYLAESAPLQALIIDPGDVAALINEAEASLVALVKAQAQAQDQAPKPDATVLARIRAQALLALSHQPRSARAMRLLGHVAELGGDTAQARLWHGRAASLSLHETGSVHAAMLDSLRRGDRAKALDYADALMRSRADLIPLAEPVLAALATSGEGLDLLGRRLGAGPPPWRYQALNQLPAAVADPALPLQLLLRLKSTALPPTDAEVDNYLSFLIGKKRAPLAYAVWLQFIPPAQMEAVGPLFNGGFELPVNTFAFNWRLREGIGASPAIVPRPDMASQHALAIEFGVGRIELGEIVQRLLLAPGTYTLRGQFLGQMTSQRGLKWTVLCAAEATNKLAQSAPLGGQMMAWRPFEMTVTVPQAGCASQLLMLEHDFRSESERFITGQALFDDLSIVRQKPVP